MSTPTRHRRRGRNNNTEPPADRGEAVTPQPVTLESKETEGFLLHRLNTAAGDAQAAQQQAQAKATEARRQDQVVAQYEATEKELIAQLQQLQADKEAASRRAEDARAASAACTADHLEFKKQEADALRLCKAAGINVEPRAPQLPNGVDPAGPTRVDLSDDDPLTGPLSRFHEAHDEQDAQSAGAA
jgi:hypothetical protein